MSGRGRGRVQPLVEESADEDDEVSGSEEEEDDADVLQYSMVSEQLFAKSPLERKIEIQATMERLGIKPRRTKQQSTPDPLLNCRIARGTFNWFYTSPPKDPATHDPAYFWDEMIAAFETLANLKKIPADNYHVQLDYLDDLVFVLDIINRYPHQVPDRGREHRLATLLGHIGCLLWYFYIQHRNAITTSKKFGAYWLTVINLHKVAVEFLPSIHKPLTDVYNSQTVEQFLAYTKTSGLSSLDSFRAMDCSWQYMRRAHVNGWVGYIPPNDWKEAQRRNQEEGIYCDSEYRRNVMVKLYESTIVASVPDASVVSDPADLSQRKGMDGKVDLFNVISREWIGYKRPFSQLTLEMYASLMSSVNTKWNVLNWTPHAEMFILLLWYHFCKLVIDAEKHTTLLGSYIRRKNRAMPTFHGDKPALIKPISLRFIRDNETILVNNLETIRMYYVLLSRTLTNVPVPRAEIREHNKRVLAKDMGPAKLPPFKTSFPAGFFDTVCFPECRQFLPTLKVENAIAISLITAMTEIVKTEEGVDTAAVRTAYYKMLYDTWVSPGDFQLATRRNPALKKTSYQVLNEVNQGFLEPISELTYKYRAALMVQKAFSPELFPQLKLTLKHIMLAPVAYACMWQAFMTVSKFQTRPVNHQQLPGDAFASMDTMEDTLVIRDMLSRDSRISATGKHSSIFSRFSAATSANKRLPNRQKTDEVDGSGDSAIRVLPIERLEEGSQWSIMLLANHMDLVCNIDRDVVWDPSKRNWPRSYFFRGEWVITNDQADFFFHTGNRLEAAVALFVCAVRMFGSEIVITSPLFSKFENEWGAALRKAFFGELNV